MKFSSYSRQKLLDVNRKKNLDCLRQFIKCPQNLQVKTLLQMYTAFICRIYNKIQEVFDP